MHVRPEQLRGDQGSNLCREFSPGYVADVVYLRRRAPQRLPECDEQHERQLFRVDDQVRQTLPVSEPVCTKNDQFYQDRLGTNIANIQKESGVFRSDANGDLWKPCISNPVRQCDTIGPLSFPTSLFSFSYRFHFVVRSTTIFLPRQA